MEEMISQLVSGATPRYLENYKDFIPGKDQVLYSGLYWDNRELEAAIKSIVKGSWITTGEKVALFQRRFSQLFEVKHSHMVNSGSSANLVLITALKKYLGWKDGAEVLVSPVGFPTTIAPLVQNNLKPVFVDIEWDTLNFDLKQLESKITSNTVAIFVSPVLGNPPNFDTLLRLRDQYGIKLIGDNCDSLGSKWKGEFIHKNYYAWSTSFYPAHHISTGEGGMVCSNLEELINVARSVAWWGRDCRCVGASNLSACGTCGNRFDKWLGEEQGIVDHKYVFANMGYNLKPLDLQGAIGLEQLKKFPEIESRRRNHFIKMYDLIMRYVDGVRIADEFAGADPCWFGVPLVCKSHEHKNKLVNFLETNKIQTRNYFAGNILLHPGYKHLDEASNYPEANQVLGKVFFLGCPPAYNEAVFNYIESILKKWN